ncbi:MAG: GTPase/DUF3482 domain-containing protein [Pseudomonadales bacterium]
MSDKDNGAVRAIQVAVVGHTNTGKTSLIRTLLRSRTFGDVANSAGTTRHVEKVGLRVGGDKILEFFDTPGLEDSSALLDSLAQQSGTARGVLETFVINPDAELEQEAKVIRQGLKSDVLLYVVDVRAQRLEKYSDELSIFSRLGIPIIPVFNFIVGQETELAAWRNVMVEHNLHAALEFDTVAFNFEAEKRLYQKLQGVLEPHYEQIQRLIDLRSEQWQKTCTAAFSRSAQLVSDCAVLRVHKESGEQSEQTVKDALQDSVRDSEKKCLRDLLRLFSFTAADIEIAQLPLSNGTWEMDLFSFETLKMFGLDARSSALKGAAAGAGLDLMVGGISLGVATTLGAIAGASFSTVKRHGKSIAAVFNQDDFVCLDDASLELLFLRQRDLLARLMQRGHAAQQRINMSTPPLTDRTPAGWKDVLRGLRSGQMSQGEHNHAYRAAQQDLSRLLGDGE